VAVRLEMVSAILPMVAVDSGYRHFYTYDVSVGGSVKRLPAATVYAAFVGIGVAGTAIIGMTVFGESTNAGRICSLVLLLAGLIGLILFSGPTH